MKAGINSDIRYSKNMLLGRRLLNFLHFEELRIGKLGSLKLYFTLQLKVSSNILKQATV